MTCHGRYHSSRGLHWIELSERADLESRSNSGTCLGRLEYENRLNDEEQRKEAFGRTSPSVGHLPLNYLARNFTANLLSLTQPPSALGCAMPPRVASRASRPAEVHTKLCRRAARWRTFSCSLAFIVAAGDHIEHVLQFEAWKAALCRNCELEGKLSGFNSTDENILWMFLNRGCKADARGHHCGQCESVVSANELTIKPLESPSGAHAARDAGTCPA